MKTILFILLLLPTLSFSQTKIEVDSVYRKYPQDEKPVRIRIYSGVPLGTITLTDSSLVVATGYISQHSDFPSDKYTIQDSLKSNLWFVKSKTTGKRYTFYIHQSKTMCMCIMYGKNWHVTFLGGLIR